MDVLSEASPKETRDMGIGEGSWDELEISWLETINDNKSQQALKKPF